MSLKNAKQFGTVFYGLHMVEGVAEYREPGKDPYRIVINENALKTMDATFPGKPVYVQHVDKVDLENIQEEADGWVAESFFNPADGKHWAKFLVVSDKGHAAIKNGWTLSNAYFPKGFGPGGEYHGVGYQKEITSGQYEHLAIVPNPRYQESVILTTEEFKNYNERKELELKRLANSKGDESMLDFFKREKVSNGKDLEGMSVLLPKSKKEMTITELVTNMDASMMPDHMANMEHHVMVGEHKMKLNELVSKHLAACNELESMKDPAFKKPGSDEVAPVADPASVEKKKNAEEEEKKKKEMEEKKKNEDAAIEAAEKDKAGKTHNAHFESLKNAPESLGKTAIVSLSQDAVARGRSRYGSAN